MGVKNGLEFFYFDIHRAPSEMPANLSAWAIQPFWAVFFLHWAVATLKGLGEFQNKIF